MKSSHRDALVVQIPLKRLPDGLNSLGWRRNPAPAAKAAPSISSGRGFCTESKQATSQGWHRTCQQSGESGRLLSPRAKDTQTAPAVEVQSTSACSELSPRQRTYAWEAKETPARDWNFAWFGELGYDAAMPVIFTFSFFNISFLIKMSFKKENKYLLSLMLYF